MPDRISLEIERDLANAQLTVWRAYNKAAEASLYGLEDDLAQIARELGRLLEDHLKSAKHLRISRI